MPDLTGMLDLYRLSKDLEGNPDAAAKFRALGPSFSESLEVTRKPSDNLMDSLQGLGLASANEAFPQSLPGARRVGPQEPSPLHSSGTGAPMSSEEADSPGGGGDWKSMLSVVGLGLTDLGNVIGNPRAKVGEGAAYQLTKQRLAESQLQQLKSRQDLWDRTHQQSQAIPPEILAMPEMSSLAQAKAALDQDLLDGKIDNEKNVSTFLTELERAKPQIQQFLLRQQVEDQSFQAGLKSEAELKLQSEHRQALEAAAAQGNPYAQAELAQLKAKDPIMREIGGQQIPLSALEFAKFEQDRQDREARLSEGKEDRASAERRHRESLAASERQRQALLTDRNLDQGARGVLSYINQSIARQPEEDPNTFSPISPEQQVDNVLKENAVDLVRIGRQMGIQIEEMPPDPLMGQGAGMFLPRMKLDGQVMTIPEGLRRLHARIASMGQ